MVYYQNKPQKRQTLMAKELATISASDAGISF
jgi:hypothetical protein